MKSTPRKLLRSIFIDDLGLKLISLVASIILFSVVHGAEDAQKSVYVDVISTLPDAESGRMLISEIPVRVRVTLVGPPAQLNAIRQGDVPPIELDLRDTHRTSVEIDPSGVDLPAGVTVRSIDPEAIGLEWVDRSERRVRVRAALVGQPRNGLMIVEPVRIDPEFVTLVGPKGEIDSLSFVETTDVELSGLGEGRLERRVRLVHLPDHVIVEGDSSVNLSFEVVPERAERTLGRVAVGAVGSSARSIRPANVTITLLGPPSIVQSIEPDSVLPYVDASGLRQSRAPQMLTVQVGGLPDGVEVRRVSPPQVLVTPGG